MLDQFSRTELIIGKEGIKKLKESKVIIFGIGGVGSYTAEALTRVGIGHLILVDPDKVELTNINRQIQATHKTIGRYKVDVMKERILDINPKIKIEIYKPNEIEGGEVNLIDNTITYVVDAIDTMKNKLELIKKANEENVKIISGTGAGNKLDATKFEVADIYKTSICPVCRILRKELKKIGIKHLKVVYSKENPIKSQYNEEYTQKTTLGSISFVPSVAGLIIAGEVIKDIINK